MFLTYYCHIDIWPDSIVMSLCHYCTSLLAVLGVLCLSFLLIDLGILINSYIYSSDGKLEIVIPSFVHYLEVLEGSDGDKLPGTTNSS